MASKVKKRRAVDNDPYFVELDHSGCPKCSHDKTWTIIGPDSYGIGQSFTAASDAAELCELLNVAYEHGSASGRNYVTDEPEMPEFVEFDNGRTVKIVDNPSPGVHFGVYLEIGMKA